MSINAEVLDDQRFSFADLQFELAKKLGRQRFPERTLRNLLREFYIQPDEIGLYHTEDLQVLVGWFDLKPVLKTYEHYKNLLRKQYASRSEQVHQAESP